MFLVNWINILNQIIDCPKQYAGTNIIIKLKTSTEKGNNLTQVV